MDNNADFQPQAAQGTAPEQSATDTSSVTSLDSLSEFEFQGERYTPERLQELIQSTRTLSEQQKKYAADERYLANIDADLEAVIENPELATKFKSVYPAKYHGAVDKILNRLSPQAQTTQAQGLPKEFLNEFRNLKDGYGQLQQYLHEMKTESAAAKIDALLPKLYEKYPLAQNVEEAVLARAEAFMQNGGKMNDQTWERFVKEVHTRVQKGSDAFNKKQLGAQLEKGLKAQDAGPGGATPGQAPRKLKSFADAEKAMIEHLKSNGGI